MLNGFTVLALTCSRGVRTRDVRAVLVAATTGLHPPSSPG
jgi:hypothetical protein